MSGIRILDREAALRLLKLAEEYHHGDRQLPPEILALKAAIAAAVRNAELFVVRVRVVDLGMVRDITELRMKLDGLYADLAEREAGTSHTIH